MYFLNLCNRCSLKVTSTTKRKLLKMCHLRQRLKFINYTVDWGRKWLVDFNAGKTQLVLFDRSNNTGAIDVKMDGSVLEEKPSFKMLGLTFSSKLDWCSYIICIAKTAPKKIGAFIHSMKFLSREVALYLYKSTIRSCMEHCCHVWAGAPSCYSYLLDKLKNGYAGLLVLH